MSTGRCELPLTGVSFAESLPAAFPDLWGRATAHPFVRAVAEGTIPRAAFQEWLRQDFGFVTSLASFVRELALVAPDADRTGLEEAAAALGPEIELFRDHARRDGIELEAEPVPASSEYVAFLEACRARGYAFGLVAYYGCERAYFESWSRVRTPQARAGPYGEWIDNWGSAPFGSFVAWLGERVDNAAHPMALAALDGLRVVFGLTISYEVAFWEACLRSSL